jgi:hypothetical protein
MPFIKNDININRNGRKKGVPNRNTKQIRELIHYAYEINLEAILSRFDELTLKDRISLNKDLIPYVLTRYSDLDIPIEQRKVNLPKWMFEGVDENEL